MANLVFVAGRKGSGKTTLLHVLVDKALEHHPDVRFVVWDRTVEWSPRDRLEVLPAREWSGEQAAQYALDRAPCTLVMPEVDAVAPNHAGALREGTALHAIVHYGRHEEVALLCDARRSARVHVDIRELADTIFFFRHTGPRDLEWIEKLTDPDWREAIRRLEPREFLRYDF